MSPINCCLEFVAFLYFAVVTLCCSQIFFIALLQTSTDFRFRFFLGSETLRNTAVVNNPIHTVVDLYLVSSTV